MPEKQSAPCVTVASRFLLGTVLPALALGVSFAMILATARGTGEAPLIVAFASLFAVPAVVLINCWTLFVEWQSRLRLFAAASALPAIVAIASALFVYGTGGWREAGMSVLLPFLSIPARRPGTLAAAWVVCVGGLLFAAWRVARRSR